MSAEAQATETLVTEAAWREFHRRLRSFVARRVGGGADADDIVQQVFLRMHASSSSIRSHASLGAWLHQAARNAIADHYRAPARRREQPAGDTRDLDTRGEPGPDHRAGGADGKGCVAGCLRPLVGRLEEPYRRAVERIDLEGRTQKQVAQEEGVSLSGMKSRVQRGRKQLKAMLLERCRVGLDARGAVTDCQAAAGPGAAYRQGSAPRKETR